MDRMNDVFDRLDREVAELRAGKFRNEHDRKRIESSIASLSKEGRVTLEQMREYPQRASYLDRDQLYPRRERPEPEIDRDDDWGM
jgi:hypothetical protein